MADNQYIKEWKSIWANKSLSERALVSTITGPAPFSAVIRCKNKLASRSGGHNISPGFGKPSVSWYSKSPQAMLCLSGLSVRHFATTANTSVPTLVRD